MNFCINHSEPNPDTKYPDWNCGKYYRQCEDVPEWKKQKGEEYVEQETCYGHSGYIK